MFICLDVSNSYLDHALGVLHGRLCPRDEDLARRPLLDVLVDAHL